MHLPRNSVNGGLIFRKAVKWGNICHMSYARIDREGFFSWFGGGILEGMCTQSIRWTEKTALTVCGPQAADGGGKARLA